MNQMTVQKNFPGESCLLQRATETTPGVCVEILTPLDLQMKDKGEELIGETVGGSLSLRSTII